MESEEKKEYAKHAPGLNFLPGLAKLAAGRRRLGNRY